MINFQEAVLYSSAQTWTLTGQNALVKVVNMLSGRPMLFSEQGGGYFTQAKFLNGMNALQVESALGLRPNELAGGCYIFYFARLPELRDVEFKYYTSMPDGTIWNDDAQRAYLEARSARDHSGSDIVDAYPPGSHRIIQWRLKAGISYKLSRHYRILTPSTTFSAR